MILRRLRPALIALIAVSTALGQDKKPAESATDPAARAEGGWWMARHEQFLKDVKPGTADLILVGDSITEGWGGNGQSTWDRHYAPRKAVNLGIGGDRTQHVLWRLDHGEIKGISPKVAVVMIGTNNLYANSPDEIAAGVAAIVKTLRDKLPRTKVLLLGVFPRGEKPEAPERDRIRAINAQIAHLDDGKTIKYLDLTPTFLAPGGYLTKDIMYDYLHLTPRGYRLWADAMEPTLWSMMEGKGGAP